MFRRSELLEMLTYCRPDGSTAENEFRARFVLSLPGAVVDGYRNVHVHIGESPVLWSSHTDTVHRASGRQTLHLDSRTNVVGLSKRSKRSSSCLGADDTAGVFLMRCMVLAGIPGRYVFHYGEERGGIGSSELAEYDPDALDGIRFAIALDRQGFSDVITRQSTGVCASDSFAHSLSAQLNVHGLTFTPCDRGVYTDTAEYAHIVPECTNLSVGYFGAHSPKETLHITHLEKLYRALCSLDVDALVCERTPELPDWRLPSWYRDERDNDRLKKALVLPFDRVDSRIVYNVCQECGKAYPMDESDATDVESFCSMVCENEWYCSTYNRDTYLNPEYTEVQRALLGLDVDDDDPTIH